MDALRGSRFGRRTFIKAVAASGSLLLASHPAWGQVQEPAPTPTDPVADLAAALDFDVDAMFRFVADRIRYEPYAGVLRGPHGVLAGGAGNSADQASLLAALLQAALVPARFVTGAIDDATAAALSSSASSTREEATRHLLDTLAGEGATGSTRTTPPVPRAVPPELGTAIERGVAQAAEVVDWVRTQLLTTAEQLQGALAASGATLSLSASTLPRLERAQHVWVQYRSGAAWIDLDPSIPAATPGVARAMDPVHLEVLPDGLRHLVRFRVVAEHARPGGLEEEVLLEVEQDAADIAGLPIGLINIDQEGLKGLGVAILSELGGGIRYVPCLTIGEEVWVARRALTIDAGTDGGPFGVGSPDPVDPAAQGPIAEWLEVAILSPDSEPVLVRREVFDRLGPAARATVRDGGPLPALDPIVLRSLEPGGPPDYLPALTSHWMTVHTGSIGGARLQELVELTDMSVPFAAPVHLYHMAREAAMAEVAFSAGVRPFIDAPNVTAVSLTQDQADDGALEVRARIDLLHRSFGHLAVDDVPAAAPPGLVSGVLAHVAERIAFGEGASAIAGALPASVSVGSVFDVARQEGVPFRLLRDAGDVAALAISADASQRLRDSLAGGWWALSPVRPVAVAGGERIGWWLVEPRSGRVVDQLDDGRGVTGERVIVHVRVIRTAPSMVRLGSCVAAGFLFAATGVLAYWLGGAGSMAAAGLLGAATGAAGGGTVGAAWVCAGG